MNADVRSVAVFAVIIGFSGFRKCSNSFLAAGASGNLTVTTLSSVSPGTNKD
jgi:hypothetical protein